MRIPQKQHVIFLVYLIAAIFLRFPSFFPSVLDHDESNNLIIGRDILNGKDLYSDVTDTKPPGIFLFYAGLEFLFGSSIFLKRLVFAIVVGFTAFLVQKVSRRLFNENKTAYAAGLIYIFYTSIWDFHGRSPNTEILFNLTTISSLLLFFEKRLLNYVLGGILMGIGFIVKYLVLFDFIVFMLFFFSAETFRNRDFFNFKIVFRFFLAGLAFSFPFALTNLWFYSGDHFNQFYYITYELPGYYGSNPSVFRYLKMLFDMLVKFFPITIMLVYVIATKHKLIEKDTQWLFALWILSILYAIYIPGKEFSHYTIQLMLPLSILAGVFFHPDFTKDRFTGFFYSGKTGVAIAFILIVVIQLFTYKKDVIKPDVDRQIVKYLSEIKKPEDKVFVSNYRQILYYLLKQDSPTPFVHSNLLFTDTHKAFKIDALIELQRIMDTKPKYVLVQQKNKIMLNLLEEKYRFLIDFNKGKIEIYQRID